MQKFKNHSRMLTNYILHKYCWQILKNQSALAEAWKEAASMRLIRRLLSVAIWCTSKNHFSIAKDHTETTKMMWRESFYIDWQFLRNNFSWSRLIWKISACKAVQTFCNPQHCFWATCICTIDHRVAIIEAANLAANSNFDILLVVLRITNYTFYGIFHDELTYSYQDNINTFSILLNVVCLKM